MCRCVCRCGHVEMWTYGDVGVWRCGYVDVDVKICRCGDV